MKQAEEVLSPIRTAIARSRGPLFKFLTDGSLQNTTGNKANRMKLASTKKGIENFITGSIIEIRPMAITKLQGLRTKIATVDEWLSTDIREDVIGSIEQGASKLDDYAIVATSSEGTIRNNAGDSIKIELLSILKGEYYNPHVSIWYYRLDDIQEVAAGIEDPRIWLKCNPNLGQTVTYDTYVRDVERSESVPSSRNDILAKRFGIPMEGFTYYFTYEETLPTKKKLNFWQMPCAMGADLSRGDDFCSFDFLFPLSHGEYGVKVRCYITSLTLAKLPTALRVKYEEFIEEGSLVVMDGAILDLVDVYSDLEKHIDTMQYDVRAMGYDPYNAKEFVQAWAASNGPYGIEKVIQGAKTETVPLGEIKILAEQNALLFDELIMQFCMGNAVTLDDTNGNRKLVKMRNEQKIDAVSALIDAFIAYKANKAQFE
jgi:phage terminase large subunit-like protein